MRILLVEDHRATRELLRRSLAEQGHSVDAVASAAAGTSHAANAPFDLFILDIQLPDGDGLDVCRRLRCLGVATPILFLTARTEVSDRVAGLDAGGDDYLKKPFALAELCARVRALGRRPSAAPSTVLCIGALSIDFRARTFRRAGVEIPLTSREWLVLGLVSARRGETVRRDELMDLGWSDRGAGPSASLDVIISRLRRKLGSGSGVAIRTMRSQGYQLVVES